MLRGSEDKKILDKGHQKLSVYGLGKDKTKEFWQSFLRQMLAYGHLKINFQKYGAIEITNTGIQVLKNEQKFMYKEIQTKENARFTSFYIIPEAAHFNVIENPKACALAINDFLSNKIQNKENIGQRGINSPFIRPANFDQILHYNMLGLRIH